MKTNHAEGKNKIEIFMKQLLRQNLPKFHIQNFCSKLFKRNASIGKLRHYASLRVDFSLASTYKYICKAILEADTQIYKTVIKVILINMMEICVKNTYFPVKRLIAT